MGNISRKRLEIMSLKELKDLRTKVSDVIREVETSPYPRDIDIALNFQGDESMVAELVHKFKKNSRGRWVQIQKIFCCEEHCKRCPHGPFAFSYKNLKNGQLRVEYQGRPVFDTRALLASYKGEKGIRGYLKRVDECEESKKQDKV